MSPQDFDFQDLCLILNPELEDSRAIHFSTMQCGSRFIIDAGHARGFKMQNTCMSLQFNLIEF